VWLIDRASIEQRRKHPTPSGRPVSAPNAWRVLLLGSGEDIDKDADPVARWRVRDALARRGLDGLQRLLRRHAEVHYFWGLPGELRRLRERDDVVLTGTSAVSGYHLDLLSGDRVEVYLPASDEPAVEREHALQPADGAEADAVLRLVSRRCVAASRRPSTRPAGGGRDRSRRGARSTGVAGRPRRDRATQSARGGPMTRREATPVVSIAIDALDPAERRLWQTVAAVAGQLGDDER
jgi:hypothetical protein